MLNYNYNKILLVDDDTSFLNIYKKILKFNEYEVVLCDNPELAEDLVIQNEPGIVITDMYMPQMNGLQLIRNLKNKFSEIQIILVTGNGSIDNAVEAIKSGAFTYVQKPVNTEELLINLRKLKEITDIKQENEYLKSELNLQDYFIGKSKKSIELKEIIEKVAKTDSSICITGESGTGKEVIAKAIHNQSARSNENLVKVNCSALSESLLESELFGHEKGSFTGASSLKLGRFERANKGTLFLDEIGEISPSIQVKLLRVLQEKEFERVGGSKTIKTNFRLISATNKDFQKEMQFGSFREDLFYRLNVIPIHVPPLRERRDDIPALIEYFLSMLSIEIGKKEVKFSAAALKLLVENEWVGNIRELKNSIERIIVLSSNNMIEASDVLKYMVFSEKSCTDNNLKSFREAKREFELDYVSSVMKQFDNNITNAADFMGIARKNLHAKLKLLNVNDSID